MHNFDFVYLLTIYTGYPLYRFRNYYVLHIPGFFDREFPEAVLKIAKFIQAQLKLNVRKYEVIIIS